MPCEGGLLVDLLESCILLTDNEEHVSKPAAYLPVSVNTNLSPLIESRHFSVSGNLQHDSNPTTPRPLKSKRET